jgi:hypothetical protein
MVAAAAHIFPPAPDYRQSQKWIFPAEWPTVLEINSTGLLINQLISTLL